MKDKKKWIYSILCLFIFVVGVSFAYFVAQNGNGAVGNIDVISNSLDDLKFSAGDPISLKITQFNFTQGGGNLSDSTTATASLKANNSTNKASYTYNVYFAVDWNFFKVSNNENYPDIILTVIDPLGNEVTSIDGLTYYDGATTKGVSGFDITTFEGVKTIADNYTITSNSSTTYTTQDWQFKVTFINYDFNQNYYAVRSINANIVIQKEELPITLADVCSNGDNLANCITNLSQKSVSGATNIYYHDSNLENGANDNSYRYAGASEKVNNFICFGSTTSPCPTNNLYRIIGVIDGKVKLIKYDYANSNLLGTDGDYSDSTTPDPDCYKGILSSIGMYSWNYNATNSATNIWSTSLLNKTNLNTNYLNNIGSTWSNKIVTTTWKVGGCKNGFNIPSIVYQNEIVNPTPGQYSTTGEIEYSAKIGLMYISDYGFAASLSAWTTALFNYNGSDTNGAVIRTINWMYMGLNEWTISRSPSTSDLAFYVNVLGDVDNYRVGSRGVRPSFNLETSITYKSGTGSMNDPIIIN